MNEDFENIIQAWLSIQSHLVQTYSFNEVEDFLKSMQLAGLIKTPAVDYGNKHRLIQYVLNECVESIPLRIELQKWFGQFDGAQICENCGKVIWRGYSCDSEVYCCIDCISQRGGEGVSLEEIAKNLEDGESPEGTWYYTEWC